MSKVHINWTYNGSTATGFKILRTGTLVDTLTDPAVRDYFDDVSSVVDNEVYYEVVPFNADGDEGSCMYTEISLLRQLSREKTGVFSPADKAEVIRSNLSGQQAFDYSSGVGYDAFGVASGNAIRFRTYYTHKDPSSYQFDYRYTFTVAQIVTRVDYTFSDDSNVKARGWFMEKLEVYGSNDDTLGVLIGEDAGRTYPDEEERNQECRLPVTSPGTYKKYTIRAVWTRPSITTNNNYDYLFPLRGIRLMGK